MRAEQPLLAAIMQRLDAPVHWLTGVHIARRTVQNVQRAGWRVEKVTRLSLGNIFRLIAARKD
jgi:hypothetical protein